MCSDSNPCYLDILEKAYRELTLISARYTRIVVVRMDLKLGEDAFAGRVDISKFRKSFVRKLERKYKSKVAYQWVREYGKSEYNNAAHWHWWVAVKVSGEDRPNRQAVRIAEIVNSAWIEHTRDDESYAQKSGFFFLSRKFFSLERRKQQQDIIANGPSEHEIDVLINRGVIASRTTNEVVGGVIDECFFALSYMAKVYTKTRTKNTEGKPVFKSSNLNTNDFRKGRQEVMEKNLSKIHQCLKEPIELKPLVYQTKFRVRKKPKVINVRP